MAFWCVVAGVAALSAGPVCLRYRLFLRLAWIVAVCFFVLVIAASLLIQAQESKTPNYNPFSVKSFCLLVIAALRPHKFGYIAATNSRCISMSGVRF